MKFGSVLYKIIFLFTMASPGICFSQVPADSTKADSLLLPLLQDQMQSNDQQPAQQQRSSLSFNPDIGVIGDFRGSYISKGKRNFDAYLNETEISLQAAVDPYLRADFFISFSRDPDTRKYGVEVEEGYLTT